MTYDEKDGAELSKVRFMSLPAVKLGKLAINSKYEGKKYGSFILDMVDTYAFEVNSVGVACRFVTVDADIEYNLNTPEFYEKNGFVKNLSIKPRTGAKTVSMRRDINS